VQDGADLLSLFLSKREIFTDEFIVDEMIDFFGAGTVTTANATMTIVNHFIKNKASLNKVRKEFDALK